MLCPGPVETDFGKTAGFTPKEEKESLPPIMWIPAPEVARSRGRGDGRGKVVVIPGVANKAGAAFATLAPKRLLASLVARNHPGADDVS